MVPKRKNTEAFDVSTEGISRIFWYFLMHTALEGNTLMALSTKPILLKDGKAKLDLKNFSLKFSDLYAIGELVWYFSSHLFL